MGLHPKDGITVQMQNILRLAHASRDATGVHPLPTNSTTTGIPGGLIDSINLPNPPALLPFLLDAGLSHRTALAASELFRLRAEELRRHIRESIITACRKIAELPAVALASSPDSFLRRVVFSFTEMYLRQLEQWKEELLQRFKHAPEQPASAVLRNSRAFNHQYTPLLEQFFEENPFPTHVDKVFLAKKSNMEYRQIHVWFQNRRNRSKKVGKVLRKKQTHEGAPEPPKLLENIHRHVVHSEFQVCNPFGAGSSATTEEGISKDALTSSPPLHAFPSSYPPACRYDPFPCKSGPTNFGKPEWRRVPHGNHPSSVSINIDDLVETFSRLSVRDATRTKGSYYPHSRAATAAITVTPCSAPHPSLMIRNYSKPADIVQLQPKVRAPVSCPKAFQTPSPTSHSVTLVPRLVPLKNQFSGERKTAPLPRRFPGVAQAARRDTTSSESSSASSSPCLLFTDFDACSCSSSISSLSTLSDTVNV